MSKFNFALLFLLSVQFTSLDAAENSLTPSTRENSTAFFEPFTGKIIRNKVRLRLLPSLDAPILRELSRDDLLSVDGESDEFYAVVPPKDIKAYIFRTYVLDNIVEGNRVNIRLEPALEAPVIAQLNSGDRVDGTISPLNSKWMEISPPATTRFFVCKEYVDNIGSPTMLAHLEKRRTEVSALLSSAHLISDNEMQKEYQEINLEAAIANLNTIIKQYTDFPKYVERAKTMQSSIQESYLQKKITYLEAKASTIEMKSTPVIQKNNNPIDENSTISVKSNDFPLLEEVVITPLFLDDDMPIEASPTPKRVPDWNTPFDPATMTGKMSEWLPIEMALFDAWVAKKQEGNPKEFYEEQFADSMRLKGIVESYSRVIRNKPGDYLLVNPITKLPISYLYSTRVNLEDHVGKEIVIHGVLRPNNNFAFPAYFVISMD